MPSYTGRFLKTRRDRPFFCVHNSALSETLEEGQELLWWPVSAGTSGEGFCFRESLLFEFKARMKVNLSRIHSFVSEPQSDNRTINARLKQIHRGAVPKNVRRDTFALERRTVLTCRGHVLGEQVMNSVSAQWLAAGAREDWID